MMNLVNLVGMLHDLQSEESPYHFLQVLSFPLRYLKNYHNQGYYIDTLVGLYGVAVMSILVIFRKLLDYCQIVITTK